MAKNSGLTGTHVCFSLHFCLSILYRGALPHCTCFGDPWLVFSGCVFLGPVYPTRIEISSVQRGVSSAKPSKGCLSAPCVPSPSELGVHTMSLRQLIGENAGQNHQPLSPAPPEHFMKTFLIFRGKEVRGPRGENNPLSHASELGTPGKWTIWARHTNHKPGNG